MADKRPNVDQPKKIIKEEKGLGPAKNPTSMPNVTPPKKETDS